jgi:nucleotide-binding universal stress UspA family protein
MLQGLVPVSAETRGITTSVHIEAGEDVAYHIVQRAKVINADVICMAAHGPGQVRGALGGSLVLDVIHRAERPLLLVR